MAQRTTLKFSNITKGTPLKWVFIFGLAEGTCAYFISQDIVRQYGLALILLPYIQWLLGQIKTAISVETPEGEKPSVRIEGEEGTELKVNKE